MSTRAEPHVPPSNLLEQVAALQRGFPNVYGRLDQSRVTAWQRHMFAGTPEKDDFGPETAGGRGESYLRAQTENMRARSVGIGALIELMRVDATERRMIVDLLGGDGLVHRVCAALGLADDMDIMTCDASPHMVRAAWEMGIPALQQLAERQLFRSESVDGVLLAYGTHHIPPDARGAVAEEAFRVLRPKGVFVLHDFLVGSPMDVWFSKIVDSYSNTGHRYVHFTAEEIQGCLDGAGFASHELMDIHDPYVAVGKTPEKAELNLGRYLVDMYGLHGAREEFGEREAFRWATDQAREIFRHPDGTESSLTYLEDRQVWELTVPRTAIVGVARKAQAS